VFEPAEPADFGRDFRTDAFTKIIGQLPRHASNFQEADDTGAPLTL